MVSKALAAAGTALDKGDDKAALVALLEAWRAKRDPRIATLVDRVSTRIVAASEPIAGKSVKARTEEWSKIAKRKKPEDVGRLVAVPWPGTWKNASPVVELACALPPDPRVAMALAGIVGDERYDTWTGRGFNRRVVTRVTSLADPRTLPLLGAAMHKPLSRFWIDDTKPEVETAIAKIRDAVVELTKAEEKALAAVEARFAEVMATERTQTRGRAEFLAAIYADASDDAARAVYADWLTEQGDPQGEFISIQLAHHQGRASDESRKRETTLLNKHGKKWAGALDTIVSKDYRRFERGFLADVIIDLAYNDPIGPAFDDASWATVHTVTAPSRRAMRVLAKPSMQRLRRIRSIEERDLAELLATPRPTVEEFDFDFANDVEGDTPEVIERGLPNLKRLAFCGYEAPNHIERFLSRRFARRLEQIGVSPNVNELGALLRLLERLELEPREITAGGGHHGGQWLFTMARDANGRLTRLRGDATDGNAVPGHRELGVMLGNLAVDDLTEFTIAPREHAYEEDDILRVETALARFPKARIEVPWSRVQTSAPIDIEPVRMSVWIAKDMNETRFRKLYERVQKPPLALAFDAFAINGGAHKPFGASGVESAISAFGKKRTHGVDLYQSGQHEHAKLEYSYNTLTVASQFRDEPGFIDAYLDWLGEFSEAPKVFFMERYDEGRFDCMNNSLLKLFAPETTGWIECLEDHKRLPLDAAEAIELPWLRKRRFGKWLALIMSPRPTIVPSEPELVELDRALIDIAWSQYGFRPHELVLEELAPLLERVGFVRHENPRLEPLGRVRYRASHPDGARAVVLSTESPLDDKPTTTLHLLCAVGQPDADPNAGHRFNSIDAITSSSEKVARKEAAALVERFDRDILGWFTEVCAPKQSKKQARR